MSNPRRPLAALAVAAMTLAGAAQSAWAGTASGRPAAFVAAPGERNDLTVGAVPATTVGDAGIVAIERVTFSDAGGPIISGLWCLPLPPGDAQCDPDGVQNGGAYGFRGPVVKLGDQDDRLRLGPLFSSSRSSSAVVDGGPGDDRMEDVGTSLASFDGGAGDDTLIGAQFLYGGAGADQLFSSADQVGWAYYSDHDATGVRVTLDRQANDGSAGEGDDVRTPNVGGSPGPDVVIGNGVANRLDGADGDDVLDGRAGDDELAGGLGADRLAGGAGNDRIDAAAGALVPAFVRDGADTITCGSGEDTVMAEEYDRVGTDCEVVDAGFFAAPATLTTRARVGRTGSAAFTLRLLPPGSPTAVKGTFRLLDAAGRPVSTRAAFTFGKDKQVARLRVRIDAATRRRLARSRAGRLTLVAQRTTRTADPAFAGYERISAPVTLRRAARR